MANPWDDLPVMPFGRYRGRPLDELPDSYLAWLRSGRCYAALREPLYSAVQDEFQRRRDEEEATHRAYRESQRRQQYQYHHEQRQSSSTRRGGLPNLTDVDDVIASGLKTLAKRFHPDVAGGDLARMQAINHAADWLRGRARELLS